MTSRHKKTGQRARGVIRWCLGGGSRSAAVIVHIRLPFPLRKGESVNRPLTAKTGKIPQASKFSDGMSKAPRKIPKLEEISMRRSTISAIRFGYGLKPDAAADSDPSTLIRFAETTASRAPRISSRARIKLISANQTARKNDDDDAKKTAQREIRMTSGNDMRHFLGEAVVHGGFGERLLSFWSDHFTVAANGPLLRVLVPDFVDVAIRPHISGRFPDMLKAATLHPAMLIYLNQVQSVGPNSKVGKRRGRGLNENLAREVLELHSMGVGADYTQEDVRNFAELLTGLSANKGGFKYRQGISEPGPHTVLGKIYGSLKTRQRDIESALTDIAMHPDTALHLAQKLQTHFIGNINPNLTRTMAKAYIEADGELNALYHTLLDSDHAWTADLLKVKTPFDFVASAIRAIGASKSDIDKIKQKDMRDAIVGAMQLMGQTPFRPPGPDGWDEAPETWITPPGLAARIRWSIGFAERIETKTDPRDFLQNALADAATPLLTRAVGGAESRVEGLAITLVSPEFNRR